MPNHLPAPELANLVYSDTYEILQSRGTTLQGDHEKAVKALIATLTETFYGLRTHRASLCDLAPGMGKTTALVAFLSRILRFPGASVLDGTEFADCGILVCLNTLDEIEAVANQLDMSSVYLWVGYGEDSGDKRYHDQCHRLSSMNKLTKPTDAQALITTHSRIEREFKGKIGSQDFSSIQSLLFKRTVRRLKIWDEAYLAGTPVSLPLKTLRRHIPKLEEVDLSAAQALRQIIDYAESEFARSSDTTSQAFQFPDFWAGHGLDMKQLEEAWADDSTIKDLDETVNVFRLVEYLSNRKVVIRHDGNKVKEALLSFVPTIPESFLPVVVLDASGRKGIRRTYDLMCSTDRLYRIEPTVLKRYDHFELDVWRKGGGKSTFRKEFYSLIEGISKWIFKLPSEGKVLVIHHKPEDAEAAKKQHPKRRVMPDMARELPRYIQRRYPLFDTDRLSFTTWGKHRGKNDWSDHPFVVAAGTLFKPDSVYEATMRIAASYEPSDGLVHDQDLDTFKLGEFADDLLQGLGRICIRGSVEGDSTQCPPAKGLIIAATKTGIPDNVADWFPGSTVRRVVLLPEVDIEGKEVKAVAAFLTKWAQRPDTVYGSTITFRDLQKALGVPSKIFSDKVKRSQDYNDYLRSIGIVEYAEKRYATGYQLTADTEFSQENLREERVDPAVVYGFKKQRPA